MWSDFEDLAFDGGGASGAKSAAMAGHTEGGCAGAADPAGQPGGAGHGARVMVDDEVIDGEPASNRRV